MERVETDLNKSKQAREKQSREFSKQIDEERNQHERKVFFFIFWSLTGNHFKFHAEQNLFGRFWHVNKRN